MNESTSIFLAEPFSSAWKEKDVFAEVYSLSKTVRGNNLYREKEGRRTLRFFFESGLGDSKSYFLKHHEGVGWKEIIKNFLQFRKPVLGAKNEYQAAIKLTSLRVDTLTPLAYGCRGMNPAKRESFLITKDLVETVSLEDYCKNWPVKPPLFEIKNALIKKVACAAKTMHENGINHRDFYICHFLLEINAAQKIQRKEHFFCYLIDLHRCQFRKRVPYRWLVKDLGGLLYSTMDIGLSSRDYFRFLKVYTGKSLRECLLDPLWQDVLVNAEKLYQKDFEKAATSYVQDSEMKQFTPEQLFACDYGLCAPFVIDLGNGEQLRVEEILRYLPDKRLACKAIWKGDIVFAKLFYKKTSQRACLRELQNVVLLKEKGINTARLLETHDSLLCQMLIYEYLPGHAFSAGAETTPAFEFIAALHSADLIHNDLHIDNIFTVNGVLYLLDTGAVEKTNNETKKIANLALFIAQFPLVLHARLIAAAAHYQRARNIKISEHVLGKHVRSCWVIRKKCYLKKIFTNCTEICRIKTKDKQIFVKRSFVTPSLQKLLDNPDAAMDSGMLLKDGNSQTVSCVVIDEARLVIKRYNQKTVRDLIKRKLGINRARNCWRHAHLLDLSGILTPAPIAIIEEAKGSIYYVSKHVDGEKLSRLYRDNMDIGPLMPALKTLFDTLYLARITHGDLKASNIMVMNTSLCLIDLDAMTENAFNYSYRRKKDINRFLENFENSDVLAKIKNYLSDQTR